VSIKMDRWGKDHWSTFAYIETRIVDRKGIPDRNNMRTDIDLHPALLGPQLAVFGGNQKYPTRLKGSETVSDHDDWSCLDDAEEYGLIENIGSGINRVYRLKERGKIVAAALRAYKADGKNFASFSYDPANLPGGEE